MGRYQIEYYERNTRAEIIGLDEANDASAWSTRVDENMRLNDWPVAAAQALAHNLASYLDDPADPVLESVEVTWPRGRTCITVVVEVEEGKP